MFKVIVLIVLFISSLIHAAPFDSSQLQNNKEAFSRILTTKQERWIRRWVQNSEDGEEMRSRAALALKQTILQFQSREVFCDVDFIRTLKSYALDNEVIEHSDDFWNFVFFLRLENLIDDILLTNLIESSGLVEALDRSPRPVLNQVVSQFSTGYMEDLDLKVLFKDFRKWPDEISQCSTNSFIRLVRKLNWKNKRELNSLLIRVNHLALKENIIDPETFARLEIFRQERVFDWRQFLTPYLEMIRNAKDKFAVQVPRENDQSPFSSKYVQRREKLTQRARLYRQFNSTQVIMLAEIINKTARRMDAYYVSINFRFEDIPESETEIYVLSPMERYRLSIKMLRKDLAEVMRSNLFSNTAVEYSDLVAAAYETGLIKSDELEMILKFEHFWNPKREKWKTYTDFAFSILGTSAFYLPPPFSLIGAIALVVTQTQLNNRQSRPDEDDNWNVVI